MKAELASELSEANRYGRDLAVRLVLARILRVLREGHGARPGEILDFGSVPLEDRLGEIASDPLARAAMETGALETLEDIGALYRELSGRGERRRPS